MDCRIVYLVYSASVIASMKYDRCVKRVGATNGATNGATGGATGGATNGATGGATGGAAGGAGATACVAKPGSRRPISPLREVRR